MPEGLHFARLSMQPSALMFTICEAWDIKPALLPMAIQLSLLSCFVLPRRLGFRDALTFLLANEDGSHCAESTFMKVCSHHDLPYAAAAGSRMRNQAMQP